MSRVVFGAHPVREAVKSGCKGLQALWCVEPRSASLDELVDAAARCGTRVQPATRAQLDELCRSTSHQGIAAVVGDYEYRDLEDLLEPTGSTPLLLVVDSVTDPQNLGAMIRSAVVLGATGLVLPKDRCVGITSTVVRVSSGATEYLPSARVTNLPRALKQLKSARLWIVGTVERDGCAPREVAWQEPTAVVLGSEQRGIRPLVLRQCDLRVTIPTPGPIAALNVAAATAIVLYEAARQRGRGVSGSTQPRTPPL